MSKDLICKRCGKKRNHVNVIYVKGENNELCANCMEDFEEFMKWRV